MEKILIAYFSHAVFLILCGILRHFVPAQNSQRDWLSMGIMLLRVTGNLKNGCIKSVCNIPSAIPDNIPGMPDRNCWCHYSPPSQILPQRKGWFPSAVPKHDPFFVPVIFQKTSCRSSAGAGKRCNWDDRKSERQSSPKSLFRRVRQCNG